MEIIKAIIPAAGLGTRFLPATKVVPKEMLPLIDKPAIQWSVEEGVKSGIKNFIFVTGNNKKSIEDYFDTLPELEYFLKERNKEKLLSSLNNLLKLADFTYVRQREPLGLGHAVWSARHTIGKEYVAIMLPDDVLSGAAPGISQLIKVATQEKCNVIAVQEVPIECISRYGVIAVKKQFSPSLFQVKTLVEKPKSTEAPSNLAIIGRYVLSPGIFKMLDRTETGSGGEIQLTDAIRALISNGEKVFAYKIQGTRYDTGTPMGWLKSNIALAIKHPEYSTEIIKFLKTIDREMLVMESKAEMIRKKQNCLNY